MSVQLALDLLQPLQPDFENFLAGRNAEAVDALRRLHAGPLFAPAGERMIYLWGAPGCGRTHLLTALAGAPHAWRWSAAEPPERVGVALVDDVETFDAVRQSALFHRLDAVRADRRLACVVTGSTAPAQLPLRADLRTRLAWGLVYALHLLTDEDKAAALHTHLAARGAQASPELIPHLLQHWPRDLRTLTAMLDALDAYALARQRPLTVPLLREWLRESGSGAGAGAGAAAAPESPPGA